VKRVENITPKRQGTLTGINAVKSQKIELFIVNAVKTSNPAISLLKNSVFWDIFN
jgi:hypothetical protein